MYIVTVCLTETLEVTSGFAELPLLTRKRLVHTQHFPEFFWFASQNLAWILYDYLNEIRSDLRTFIHFTWRFTSTPCEKWGHLFKKSLFLSTLSRKKLAYHTIFVQNRERLFVNQLLRCGVKGTFGEWRKNGGGSPGIHFSLIVLIGHL